MTDQILSKLSFDERDEVVNPPPAVTDFDRIVEAAISRRGFLGGLLVFGSGAAALGGNLLSTTAVRAADSRFAFKPIPIATDATVHVPDGYTWAPLAKWGQPLFSGVPDLDHATGGDLAHAEKVFGENTDGMETFIVDGRQLIAVNHEYVNPEINLPQNPEGKPAGADDVRKLQSLQGVTVMEIAEGPDGWSIVLDSPYNRRIHNNTPMVLDGPAAGHDLVRTDADPDGTKVLGTLNNCGSGRTPWGTYLTCEENFNSYFGSTEADPKLPADFKRYGIAAEGGYAYETFDPRFDVSKNPNEPHRFGYVVEIDPADPTSTPVKHTALGRFKHENAEMVVARDGRVVVYMGDDERGEFLYRWVSKGVYVPGGDTATLLSDGTLFVARFAEDGSGAWLALTPETTGMPAAEIAIFTRMAASKVGATTMDRPEWVAVNPIATECYCCLTNNSRRGTTGDDGKARTNAGGDAMGVGGPNPRAKNDYGQIVRWYPADDDHAADRFRWDLYVMAGNPVVHKDSYAGSGNIHDGNMFNSPDGMQIDTTGLIWIQTDGEDSNEGDFAGQGNNQMLAGDPATGRIERFLTGPKGAEVTGLTWSADRRTMFVGIQHPDAPFPDGDGKLPRSTIIAIKRADNALVG